MRKLHEPLGRIFRYFIWQGVGVWINDESVAGVDPLFLHKSTPLKGAAPCGEPLTFEIRVPGQPGKTSMVRVRFAELPVAKWHDLPVEDKRKHGIVDGAGLSIMRANREVDYGWWFFGAKRRENYDSWWRGELSFEPDLDELFSITHSKQGINPTQELREILTPDLEAIARQLNSRVQAAFASVKAAPPKPTPAPQSTPRITMKADQVAPKFEARLPVGGLSNGAAASAHTIARVPEKPKGPGYHVSVESLGKSGIFEVELSQGRWRLILNSDHPFYRKAYEPLRGATRRHLEQVLLAHGQTIGRGRKRIDTAALSDSWAQKLAEMLEVDG